MSQLNRRNALAAVAGLPAVAALPAAAVASADTELLALGAQLEPILELWAAQSARDRREQAHFEAKVEQATGITFEEAPPIDRNDQYWIARDAISKACHANDPIGIDKSDPWTLIHAQLNPLVNEILSRKAQIISGLAVQAQAHAVDRSELWDSDDPEDIRARAFIESVCTVAGITPLPAVCGVTLPAPAQCHDQVKTIVS